MKVTYELELDDEKNNDRYELKLIQKASDMHDSLCQISDYLREIRKGWKEDNGEIMEEKISEMIGNSGLHEIE